MSKKNEWTKVSFEDIVDFITREEISKISFARKLGITNSTFHNWKNGKSVPDEPMQEKIAAMIGTKTGKGKGKAKAASLDDLKKTAAASPRAATAARRAGKKVQVAKGPAKRMERKTTPRPAVAKALGAKAPKPSTNGNGKHHTNGNGNGNGNGHGYAPSERAFLISTYVEHHGVGGIDEFKQLIENVNAALSVG